MIGLLQRVTEGRVVVDGHCVGEIAQGLVVLIGVQKTDDEASTERLLERLLGYRVFPDETGRMNLSLRDIDGGLLLVPQFTLAANTQKGTRAGFSSAADPVLGARMFEHLMRQAKQNHQTVASGEFGADMQVSLTNDGPVTFWLES
ncbi:MAG: D-tyrosyl-tRNA(Tyr) deacylase [Candidatus Thiodiazotropha sp. (ex Semelilucina semeliformis)]|nr:D-tyrosyl-tRNA(Tyr) deacylase [Candidatus Thiodiazotropha sp. (ex Myrtea spinifera)]MCU7808031.1 D-tyrosyl-tRNA(Tyr) deacylase [Candidatus Thiodiazotropha sp. (ex Semelilucina semeliformis)]MCU7827684.1 D-tyrosyl-tRNA(Tyr) deacylase [Candidatus Thiodiazotropha sp. (ex Myrtea sp. 'scaly one' KF741663)]